jgi:hypothetical protein
VLGKSAGPADKPTVIGNWLTQTPIPEFMTGQCLLAIQSFTSMLSKLETKCKLK